MKLIDMMELAPGVISIIGSGGKTSLMYRLAEESAGKTVICTSTHIMPPETYPVSDPTAEELACQLEHFPAVCIGRPAKEGKLTSPSLSWLEISELADFVIIEADGSRHLPLKAHAAHEPVIPDCTGIVIQVVGCSGFGKPISEVCHRPERFAELAGCSINETAEPQLAAKVIEAGATLILYS